MRYTREPLRTVEDVTPDSAVNSIPTLKKQLNEFALVRGRVNVRTIHARIRLARQELGGCVITRLVSGTFVLDHTGAVGSSSRRSLAY